MNNNFNEKRQELLAEIDRIKTLARCKIETIVVKHGKITDERNYELNFNGTLIIAYKSGGISIAGTCDICKFADILNNFYEK